MNHKSAGDSGEEIASKYLESQGYEVLERNFRIRGGEIDIIAKDKEYLVFVEVKTRWSHEYGLPVESITPWKIRYLLKTAQFYLIKMGWGDKPYRLDFLGIDFVDHKDPVIEYIQNITG